MCSAVPWVAWVLGASVVPVSALPEALTSLLSRCNGQIALEKEGCFCGLKESLSDCLLLSLQHECTGSVALFYPGWAALGMCF